MELDVDLGQRSPARAEPFADAFAPAEPETVLKAGKPWLMHPSPRRPSANQDLFPRREAICESAGRSIV